MKKDNKDLYEFAEEQLGEKLTKRDRAKYDRKRRDSTCYDGVATVEFAQGKRWKNVSLFRYAVVMFVTLIICLSVVLPITVNTPSPRLVTQYVNRYIDRNVYVPTPVPLREYFFDDVEATKTDHSFLSSLGVLLFAYRDDEQMLTGMSDFFVEIARISQTVVSYTTEGYVLIIDSDYQEQIFEIDMRIRTHRRYYFTGYFGGSFATLRYKHDSTEINDVDKIYDFGIVESVESEYGFATADEIHVHAFIKNDIPVFIFNDYELNHAYIYFVFNGLEYFITINVDLDFNNKLTPEYIKNYFIGTLFGNITVNG